MGIRGLTTYIESHSDTYLKDYRLKNTHVVIDGNSIASCLYNWCSDCNSAFGGDYDRYATCITNFFRLLEECKIVPIVLLDGGYEAKKINTVYERLRNKILTFKSIDAHSMLNRNAFPLMMKDVFKDVMNELNIVIIQCEFEADSEIAAVARYIGCPVLSYDSDFYMLNVSYIPFNTLELKSYFDEDDNISRHLNCKLYNVETFIQSFGGLDKCMLPLMATVLGNDYISRSTFQNFFSQIKIPKSRSLSETQRKISGVLNWLREQTFKSALEKVLSCVKKNERPVLKDKMRTSLACYRHSSKILPLLIKMNVIHFDVPPNCPNDTKDKTYDILDMLCESDEGHGTADQNYEDTFPEWFKNNFHVGKMPASFMDMLVLKTYFLSSQVEDFSQKHSHEISIPIISVIFDILNSVHTEKQALELVTRNDRSDLHRFKLPVTKEPVRNILPNLIDIPQLSNEERAHVIFESLKFDSCDRENVQKFPEDWKIFITSLVYWLRNVEMKHASSLLNSVIVSAVILKVVNKYTRHYKSKKYVLKAVKRELSSVSKNETAETVVGQAEASSIFKTLCEDNVLRSDCFILVEPFLHFGDIDSSVRHNKNMYGIDVLHSLAQLQSCIQHLSYLNALLRHPFEPCNTAKFFSGTMIYNFFIRLKKQSNLEGYVSNMLNEGYSVKQFYCTLIDLLKSFLPEQNVVESCNKQRKKKKKKPANKNTTVAGSNEDLAVCEEVDYFEDVNNRFSKLQMCSDCE